MTHQDDPNPYAPNPYDPNPVVGELFRSGQSDSRRIPTLGLLAATLAGVVLSGAAFGMILAGFIALAEPANLFEFPVLLPLGIIVGGVIAAISGTPTVLVTLCLSAPIVPLSKGWLSHQAHHYASICGFFSGSSPVILIDHGDLSSWMLALVPGIFGALGARFFVGWIFRSWLSGTAGDVDHTLVEQSGNIVT